MKGPILWTAVTRNALPGIIAEGAMPELGRSVPSPAESTDEVIVGCTSDDGTSIPVVAVLDTAAAREILAWLATYSQPSFPVSQCMRTLTRDDFQAACYPNSQEGGLAVGHWPSIILGELLGQGEYNPDLASVPISRATACFGFARARTHVTHRERSTWADTCVLRLQALELDGLFVRRAISVSDLKPIWDCAVTDLAGEPPLRSLIEIVRRHARGDFSDAAMSDSVLLKSLGVEIRLLSTGPMESRVRAFQQFLDSMRGVVDDTNIRSASMVAAAAAVIVGNGTSHISLLEDFGKKIPLVFAWFGLFAAIAGPKAWDPAWNRATNSVARLMRGRYDMTDSPTFDLSWPEYEFVRAVAKPRDFVRHLPKLYPKLLSIEIIPGAACQLRISDEVTSPRPALPGPGAEETKEPLPQSQLPVREIAKVLTDLESVLGNSRSAVNRALRLLADSTSAQSSLFHELKKPNRRGRARQGE